MRTIYFLLFYKECCKRNVHESKQSWKVVLVSSLLYFLRRRAAVVLCPFFGGDSVLGVLCTSEGSLLFVKCVQKLSEK